MRKIKMLLKEQEGEFKKSNAFNIWIRRFNIRCQLSIVQFINVV